MDALYLSTDEIPLILDQFDNLECVENLEDELDTRKDYEVFITDTYPTDEIRNIHQEKYDTALKREELPEDVFETDSFEYHLLKTLSFQDEICGIDSGVVLEKHNKQDKNLSEFVADYIQQQSDSQKTTIIVEGDVSGIDVVLNYRNIPLKHIE